MTTETSVNLSRKKHSILWWIGGVFLVLIVLFLWQLFGPGPPIIVSRATTYITEPLGPDGLPDYGQYVLQRSRQGVTPENNAAVLLWQALWPGELEPKHYAVMADELGLDGIPSADDSLLPLRGEENQQRLLTWLRDRQANDDTQEDVVDAVLDGVMSRPWASEQIPPLAAWVAENEEPLELIMAASRRPRYYSPSPSLLDGSDTMFLAILLPDLQGVREAGRALSARAMWHLGERRSEEAWNDLLAVYRLAQLVRQGSTLVDQLVAMALDGIAREGTIALLDSHDLGPELALQVQKDLAELEMFDSVADTLDQAERLQTLDSALHMRLYGADVLSDDPSVNGPAEMSRFGGAFDWNVILQDLNDWYDRLIAAARLPDRSGRAQAMAAVENDLRQADDSVRRPSRFIAALVSRRARSQMISTVLASLMVPGLKAATAAEDRTNTQLDLIRLAAALAVYRAEHGAYPEKLDDLVPGVLPKLPVDLYNGKPFIYQRDGEGYLLYSVGENGTDDGGSNVQRDILAGRAIDDMPDDEAEKLRDQIPAGADDIAIRIPRPALKLPEMQPHP